MIIGESVRILYIKLLIHQKELKEKEEKDYYQLLTNQHFFMQKPWRLEEIDIYKSNFRDQCISLALNYRDINQ